MNAIEIRKAAKRFVAKEKRRRSLDRKRWEEADRDARKILDHCVRSHPVRIFQWGSVLHPERFREWSDIDFALEGLCRRGFPEVSLSNLRLDPGRSRPQANPDSRDKPRSYGEGIFVGEALRLEPGGPDPSRGSRGKPSPTRHSL